jgi:hypothetical protein
MLQVVLGKFPGLLGVNFSADYISCYPLLNLEAFTIIGKSILVEQRREFGSKWTQFSRF